MSKFTDQCPVQSSIMGMHITHQALHVIEWENIMDTYGTSGGEVPVIRGKRAKRVMCICAQVFEIEEATDSPKPVKGNERTTDPARASSEPEGKPNE